MKPSLQLLDLADVPIFNQLQLEEALLRADTRNWCLINTGASPAIVMGISGKEKELLELSKIASDPIPVIRRFSGGGTVVVDPSTLFVTFICNSEAVSVPCYPRHVMKWSEKVYQPIFSEHDFSAQENDYVLGNKKFGGNAQYMCKGRWLHHSSLLWDFDPSHMDYLQIPKKAPEYRQGRGHGEFLCGLREVFPEKGALKERIVESLGEHFVVSLFQQEDAREVLDLPHRKATKIVAM